MFPDGGNQTCLPTQYRPRRPPPPHTYSPRQVPKHSKLAAPQFLQLVDGFGDAFTAVSLDALQFNTSMDVDEDLNQACPALFRLLGLGLITILLELQAQASRSFLVALTAYER